MTLVPLLSIFLLVLVLIVAFWNIARLFRPDVEPSSMDPILGARDRVAVYRPSGALIRAHPAVVVPMPDHLKTKEDMVAWMTKDLPAAVETSMRCRP